MPRFVFPGLAPYVDLAAKALGYEDWGKVSVVKGLWPSSQVQSGLGQLPAMKPESRAEMLRHVVAVRQMVAVMLDAIDAAILDTTSELELPVPAEIAGRNTDGPDPAQAEPEPRPSSRRASKVVGQQSE